MEPLTPSEIMCRQNEINVATKIYVYVGDLEGVDLKITKVQARRLYCNCVKGRLFRSTRCEGGILQISSI